MSNMYGNTKSINPLGGPCKHLCKYCSTNSLRRRLEACRLKYSGKHRLFPDELKKFRRNWNGQVFVCGQNDLFESHVPTELIRQILIYIIMHGHRCNTYMFQSKDPILMEEYAVDMTKKYSDTLDMLWGTTIETDKEDIKLSEAPGYKDRAEAMRRMKDKGVRTYITIEPIVDFTPDFWKLIVNAKPDIVYVGADSKNNKLPEPSREQIEELVAKLEASNIPEVRVKPNLKRLLKNPKHHQNPKRKGKGGVNQEKQKKNQKP